MPGETRSEPLAVLLLLLCGTAFNTAAALAEHDAFPRGRTGFNPDVELREKIGQELKDRSVAGVGEESAALPDSFDSRSAWPNCVHAIRNQGACGSCWAFGTSEAISDRFCIATNGSTDVVLSPEELVDCNLIGLENCKRGGDPATAMVYTSTHGLASDACYPYTAGRNSTEGTCRKTCANGTELDVHKTKLTSLRWHVTVAGMQQAIYAGGPIVSCFSIYSDLSSSYDGRVYSHGANATKEGGHCVKIVGWGTMAADNDGGGDYWIIANSWGQHWGPLGGYFLMARGTNEGNIEREAFSIDPDV